ncbi:MAG: amidohydrolase/deacetylase family metallohydrolase [Bryobacterales bacterium]|nr:amidohydrolase/deacetylase family metallohydrolase [Bryobacterales bacterium]
MRSLPLVLILAAAASGQTYDLLLKGGHVIDPKNNIDAVRDVAIAGNKIAKVAANIPATDAKTVVNAMGLYVTPGLVDIHVHVYAGTGMPGVYTGDLSVYPDGFTFRTGVTTVADAGTAGWRNFPDFKQRVIDRARTRVLAFINIAGLGMQGRNEGDSKDMEPEPVARIAKQFPQIVVGVKTAHYPHKDWTAVENAVKAGTMANIPVMVDFGSNHPERPIETLLMDKLRPGDIYTHMYSGLRNELTPEGKINPGMYQGRKRGVIFDVGHGGGSFFWPVAVAAYKQGFPPDSISTDLHVGSMNAGMKTMLNTASKILTLGSSLQDVIKMSTWSPAQEIKHPELGHLSEGAVADVAVLKLNTGTFGYLDSRLAKMTGTKKITCEMTIRDGRVVYDLNGLASEEWQTYYKKNPMGQRRRPQQPQQH